MKKIIPLSLIAASTLFAGSINVNTGWNLVGAVDDINPSSISCVKAIWAYDQLNGWSLHQNIDTSTNFGYDQISTLSKGQGFWLNSDCQTTIEYSDTTTSSSYFDLFGFNWEDVKKDDRYTVLGNTVSHDSSLITLETVIREDLDSRTEVKTSLSTPSKSVSSTLKITQTDTGYNKLEFRAYSNVTISSDVQTALGLNSTYVRSYSVIGMTGKKIYSYVYLDDGATEAKVYDSQDSNLDGIRENESSMYYNETTSILVGKTIDMNITTDGSSVTFSATDTSGAISISPVTFTPPTGTIISDTDQIGVRTKILDDYANTDGNTAGASISAEVYSVSTADTASSVSDLNVTTIVASTLNWSSISNAIGVEDDDHDFYSIWDLSASSFTITEKELDGTSWIVDETFGGTVTQNTDQNVSILETSEGFGADILIKKTEQITSIDGTSYSDLYVSDLEFHVTAAGTPWTDIWDWAPTYWDGSQEISVTTTQEFLNMALTNNHWFGSDEFYPMLDGSTTDTSGNVVAGSFVGYCDMDGDGTLDMDCKNVERTDAIIGSWSLTTEGIYIDTPNETNTISIVTSTLTSTGYAVQSIGTDKVGSVWHEKIYTGSDATEILIQSIVKK